MLATDSRDKIFKDRLIAVIRLHDATRMFDVVSAIVAGGITNIEITLNTPDASKWIGWYADDEAVLVGAGTVLSPEDCDSALTAGAQFLVSPIHFDEFVPMAHAGGAAAISGGLTPTEIYFAHLAGADAVKVFPLAGLGPEYLKALRGPLPNIPLVPSNGVTLDNAATFIEAGATALGVGSPLVNQQLVDQGKFDEITRRAKTLVEAVGRRF